jgi:hypothetical protein
MVSISNDKLNLNTRQLFASMSENCKLLYAWVGISEMSLLDLLQCDHKKFKKFAK